MTTPEQAQGERDIIEEAATELRLDGGSHLFKLADELNAYGQMLHAQLAEKEKEREKWETYFRNQDKGYACCLEENEVLKSDLAKAREALKPFADYADSITFTKLPDNFCITNGSPMARTQITAGDLRHAVSFLAALNQKGE